MSGPKAVAINLSEKQRDYLQQLYRRHKSPQTLVTRAAIILKADEGLNNQQISDSLGSHRITVRKWRKQWAQASDVLAEQEKAEPKKLYEAINNVLSDAYRSGTPATFSSEQVVQIIAIACETPADSGLPLSHWTPRALADEAIKRGIVTSISAQSVERFLKASSPKTAPISLLADKRAS
jgi:putative transposase